MCYDENSSRERRVFIITLALRLLYIMIGKLIATYI